MSETFEIAVLRLSPTALLPVKAHEDDAGYDLFACKGVLIPAGESRLVPTGIALSLPPLTEAQIRPRSGLALKHQITLLNTPGTIDAGYRGEVGVIMINHGKEDFHVTAGMRIAQLVIGRVLPTVLREVAELAATARGEGGFGSTGMTTFADDSRGEADQGDGV